MADELYDYFGGNASKKVEPIEDDDLEETESDECLDEAPQHGMSESESKSSIDIETVQDTETESSLSDRNEKIDPETEPGKKRAGHWDFLANMLGIPGAKSEPKSEVKSETPKTSRKRAARSKKQKPLVSEQDASSDRANIGPSDAEASSEIDSQDDFFGIEKIRSPEDETVLPSMFSSSSSDADSTDAPGSTLENADDLIGWNPVVSTPTVNEEDNAIDSDDELVAEEEFVKETVSSSVETPSGAFAKQDDVDDDFADGDDEFIEFEIEELDSSSYDESDAFAHGRKPRRRRPPAAQEPSEISDTHASGDSDRDEPNADRKPRSRRGRSKSSTSQETRRRKPDRSRTNRKPVEQDRSEREEPAFGAGLDDSESDNLEQAPAPPKRKRRRRGSRSRSNERQSEEIQSQDDSFGAGLQGSDSDFDTAQSEADTAQSEADTFQDEPNELERNADAQDEDQNRRGRGDRSRGRRPRRRGQKGAERNADSGSEREKPAAERKRVKVPTWDEAISGMIDSNIENHKRSGQSRRGSGGGNRGGRRRR